jgi:hypothetical protein
MRKSFLRLAVIIILAISFIFPISSASLAEKLSVSTKPIDVWDLQKMPVVYDGTRYTADEFHKMKDNLDIAVYFPDKSTGEKILYVFSNTEDFTKQFHINTPDAKSLGDNTIDLLDPGFAYLWVDINYSGNCLAMQEGNSGNMASQWNNVFSSVQYPYYSGYTYYLMVLCGGFDYAQPFFYVPINGVVPNLVDEEFNDVTSSITWTN